MTRSYELCHSNIGPVYLRLKSTTYEGIRYTYTNIPHIPNKNNEHMIMIYFEYRF